MHHCLFNHISIILVSKIRTHRRVSGIRTRSRPSRYTLARRTINSASILLERLLRDTACAVGSLTVLKYSAGGVADVFDVGDGGGGDGDEAEEEGGDGELHFGGF